MEVWAVVMYAFIIGANFWIVQRRAEKKFVSLLHKISHIDEFSKSPRLDYGENRHAIWPPAICEFAMRMQTKEKDQCGR